MASGTIVTNHDYSGTNVAKVDGISGTIDNNSCQKVGNIVSCGGRIHTMNNETATGTFFVIPEGYRPLSQVRCFGYMNINNVGWVPTIAVVNTNGSVDLSYSSLYTCTQVGFAATYSI